MRATPTAVVSILAALCFAASASAQPAGGADTATASRPNILLIIGDDFGGDATSDMYPPGDQARHFCRLTEVVDKHAFL